MQKKEILDFLKQHKEQLQQKYKIKKIALFGSYARDSAKEDSDIDLSIETDENDPFLLVHLKEELSQALQKPIDIIRYRQAMNPYLKKHIEEDAIYV